MHSTLNNKSIQIQHPNVVYNIVLFKLVQIPSICINSKCMYFYAIQNEHILQELIRKGFNKFERGDIVVNVKAKEEICYFRRMVECML